MGGFKFQALLLAASAAAVALARPADAQCRLCDQPTTIREENAAKGDVQLEVETSLDFDRLILFGIGEGAALIRPDGSKSAEGAVADIGPRAMVGSVTIRGEPGRSVRVDMPRLIQLHSLGGGAIDVDQLVSDLPSLPKLDSAGTLSFRFGGRVRITGDADGEYRGDLPITVEYQ